MNLRTLQPEGRRLLVPELASDPKKRWPKEAWLKLSIEHPATIDLSTLDRALDQLGSRDGGSTIDPDAAEAIHRSLPLSRREATDVGVFRFLAVAWRPDFVRLRWKNRSWPVSRARFWRSGTRPDSNVFARLWWIAELSRDGARYDVTKRLLSRQPLANNLFVRQLCWYPPAVRAYLRAFEHAPSAVIERCMRTLQRRLSTITLEALTEQDLVDEFERSMSS